MKEVSPGHTSKDMREAGQERGGGHVRKSLQGTSCAGGFSLTLQWELWRVTYVSELYQPAVRELSIQSLAPRGDVNTFHFMPAKEPP